MKRTSTSNRKRRTELLLRFPRVRAELAASALKRSFRAILAQTSANALPMVKADAYGHGAPWVTTELLRLKSSRLEGFGVASLEEGALLREGALARHAGVRVLCFSGASPWSEEKWRFCERYALTPVLAGEEDFRRFLRQGVGRLPYELKFDTGMHRLGLAFENAREIAASLAKRPAREQPRGILSHLAMSEDPQAPLTRLQISRFLELRRIFAGSGARFHLSNSGAIWNENELGLRGLTDFVRPGISLYGVPPWPGAELRGIEPVMRVLAQVIGVRRIPAGESVGYGATFTAPDELDVGVLSGGYADGIKRSLSNCGQARIGNGEFRFLGIVSMDLSVIGAKGLTPKLGQWAELLGGGIDPWAQAKAAGSIPYELLTSWSARVERVYT